MLHWNLEKNLVTIVCGHQAIVIFFRHTSCLFFGSLSGLQFAAWQPQQQEQLAVEISLNPLAIYSALRKAHHTCGSLFKFVLPARLGAP